MRVLSLEAAVKELKEATPNATLTALSIQDYDLSLEDVKTLANAIRGSRVEILMLNSKNIDDGSLLHLVEHGLLNVEEQEDEDDEAAPPLRVLSVTKNNLTAESSVALAKLIATSSTLQRLYLRGNPKLLGDADSLWALEQAASKSESLTVLDLGNGTMKASTDVIAGVNRHTESNQLRVLQEDEEQEKAPPPPPATATAPEEGDGDELDELQIWQQRRGVVIVDDDEVDESNEQRCGVVIVDDDDEEEEAVESSPQARVPGVHGSPRQYRLLESASSLRNLLASQSPSSPSQRKLASSANDNNGENFPYCQDIPSVDEEDKHSDPHDGPNDEQVEFLQEVKTSLAQSHPEMYDLFVDVLRNAKKSTESYNNNGNNTDWIHQRVEFIFQNHQDLLRKFRNLVNIGEKDADFLEAGENETVAMFMEVFEKSNPTLFSANDSDLLMSTVAEEGPESVEDCGTTLLDTQETAEHKEDQVFSTWEAVIQQELTSEDQSPRGVDENDAYVEGSIKKVEDGDKVSDDGVCQHSAPILSEPISAESLALLDAVSQKSMSISGPLNSAPDLQDEGPSELAQVTAGMSQPNDIMQKSLSMPDSALLSGPKAGAEGSISAIDANVATSLSSPAAFGRSAPVLTPASSTVEDIRMTPHFQKSAPALHNANVLTANSPECPKREEETTDSIPRPSQYVHKATSLTEPLSRESFVTAPVRAAESLPEMSTVPMQTHQQTSSHDISNRGRRFLSTLSSLGIEKRIDPEEQESEDVQKGRSLMKLIFFPEEAMTDDYKLGAGSDSERSVSNRDIDDMDGDGPPFDFPVEYLELCTSRFSDETRLGRGAFGEVFCGTDRVLRRRFAIKRIALDLVSETRPSGRQARSSKGKNGSSARNSTDDQGSAGAYNSSGGSQDEEEEDDRFADDEDDGKLAEARRSIQRELLTLSHFRHPNMANLYGYHLSPEMRGRHYLVYEYASYGSLDRFLGAKNGAERERLSWDQRIRVALDVATALNYLHKGGSGYTCFHRDIKSANICLKRNFSAKLIDCGLSKMVPTDGSIVGPSIMNSSGAAVFGTSGYLCPKYSQGGRQYIAAFDVFSYGMVLIELITGHLQFGTTADGTRLNFYDMYVEADDCATELESAKDEYAGDWDPDLLPEFCSVAAKCVKMKPPDRPKTDTIVRSLRSIVNRLNDQDVVVEDDLSCRSQRKEAETEEPSRITGIQIEDARHHEQPEVKGQCSCCLLDDVVGLKCRRLRYPHFVCKDCMEDHVWESLGAPNISCPISGCRSGPFTEKEIAHAISVPLVNLHRQEQGRKRQVEMLSTMSRNHKENLEMHHATQTQLNRMEGLLQQSIATLASMKEGDARGCPSLVMVAPAAAAENHPNGRFNPLERIQSLYKTKIDLFFICEKSFTAIDAPIRLKVTKEWMAKLAPVLKASVFVLQTAIVAARLVTGFPLPLGFSFGTDDTGDQLELIQDVVDDMLGHEARQALDTAKSSIAPQSPEEAASTARSIPVATKRLIGDGYSFLCEKALKPKYSGWKNKICPVLDESGNVIWVKNEFRDEFKQAG